MQQHLKIICEIQRFLQTKADFETIYNFYFGDLHISELRKKLFFF